MDSTATWVALAAAALSALPARPPLLQDPPAPREALSEAELGTAREALERLAEGMEEVRELRAAYTQVQESLLLEEPLVSSGTLHVRKDPGCLVLEVEQPRPLLVRSDARTHLVYHPERKRAERFVFESNELTRSLLACFTGDARRVEQVFVFTGVETTAPDVVRLDLSPRGEALREHVTRLSLSIDVARRVPLSIVQVNPEGEELTLELSKVTLDPERDPDEVPIYDRPLPADVKVVERKVERRIEREPR